MHLVSLGAKLKLKHFEQVHRRFTRIEMLDFATPGGAAPLTLQQKEIILENREKFASAIAVLPGMEGCTPATLIFLRCIFRYNHLKNQMSPR